MLLPAFLSCKLGFHEPRRGAVHHDGHSYVGSCQHCGKPIRRQGRRNWRAMSVEDAQNVAARLGIHFGNQHEA